MKDRREILMTALHSAGLFVSAPLARNAMEYVRTEDQRGQFEDEVNRFHAELDSISTCFEIHPAESLMPALYGLWANLDAIDKPRSHPRIQKLKARTALYAGTLSSTLGEPRIGAQWFNTGHGYAILAGDLPLKSLMHSREAIAGIYWGRKIGRIEADVELARKYARNPLDHGLATMVSARVTSETRQRKSEVARAIEAALENAVAHSGEAPRPDEWWTHQAELMAAVALSGYGGMMGAVLDLTRNAVAALPRNAVLLRTHAQLTLADAYVSDGEYDQAATLTLTTLRGVPYEHRHAVLLSRADKLQKRIKARVGRPMAVVRLAEGLKSLRYHNGHR